MYSVQLWIPDKKEEDKNKNPPGSIVQCPTLNSKTNKKTPGSIVHYPYPFSGYFPPAALDSHSMKSMDCGPNMWENLQQNFLRKSEDGILFSLSALPFTPRTSTGSFPNVAVSKVFNILSNIFCFQLFLGFVNAFKLAHLWVDF